MAYSNHPNPNAKTSSQAIWSLVLGILSNTCLWILGSIPAIILGILAIKTVDRSEGQVRGKGLAIAGIVTGAVGVLLGLIPLSIAASVALPVTLKIQEKAELARQIGEMRLIALGCISYASDHDQKFPDDLAMLITESYLFEEDVSMWGLSGASSTEGKFYRYRSDFKVWASPDEPFLAAPVAITVKIAVAYPDGRVEAMREEDFNAKFADSFP